MMYNYVTPIAANSSPNTVAKYLPADVEMIDLINSAPVLVPELSELLVEQGKIYKIHAFGVARNLNDLGTGIGFYFVQEDGADGLWSGLGLGQTTPLGTTMYNKVIQTQGLFGQYGIVTESIDFLDQPLSLTIHASFVCTVSGTLDLHFGSQFGTTNVVLSAGATIFIEEFDQ